jgi:hypothetical protein
MEEEDIKALSMFLVYMTLISFMNCSILTSLFDRHRIKINFANIVIINYGLIYLMYGYENYDAEVFKKISARYLSFLLIPLYSFTTQSMKNLSIDLQI